MLAAYRGVSLFKQAKESAPLPVRILLIKLVGLKRKIILTCWRFGWKKFVDLNRQERVQILGCVA